MKLLLTSNGISNQSIANALESLADKKANAIKIGFIPTAANVEGKNKDWFVNQFINLRKFGFNWIDVIDPSANSLQIIYCTTDRKLATVFSGGP